MNVALSLGRLDEFYGFSLQGLNGDDSTGVSVASAGDINGDGFDDILIGAEGVGVSSDPYDPNGDNFGATYVVFGKSNGFGSELVLSDLDGSNGFRVFGENNGANSGHSVASAGDLNGDGYDDIFIGAPGAYNDNGQRTGAGYIVFGKSGGFEANLNLSTLESKNGFKINGEFYNSDCGYAVASAGDINHDGYSDLLISAPKAEISGSLVGTTYVVFGKSKGFGTNIDLSTLDGKNGFRVDGEVYFASSSTSVASAIDFNGDGFDDIILRIMQYGTNGSTMAAYVVFGKSAGFDAVLDLSSLDGTNGVRITDKKNGSGFGVSVASAGDINGDGISDIVIGADKATSAQDKYEGASYVIFGSNSAMLPDLDVKNLNGANGFKIIGDADLDKCGHTVASAGDFNGDGFDDIIVGAPGASSFGASYLLFGKAGGFDAEIKLSVLTEEAGFKIYGASHNFSGIALASAGDINGDGFDDLIFGSPYSQQNGSNSGASFIIYGHADYANWAPFSVDKTLTLNEDDAYAFGFGEFDFADPDSDQFTGVFISTLPATGSFTFEGVAVVVGQFIPVLNFQSLIWTPEADANGEALDSFTFRLADDGGTALGGFDTDPNPNTIMFNVTATEDEPYLANPIGNLPGTPDVPFKFMVPADTFKDADTDDILALSAQLSNGFPLSTTWLAFDPSSGVFSGTPTADDQGTLSVTITAADNSGASVSDTFEIVTDMLNDAPNGSNGLIVSDEDTVLSFTAADFGFSDPNENAFKEVIIDGVTGKGVLKLAGVTIESGAVVALDELVNLTFRAARNEFGEEYATLSFRVVDDGSNGPGEFDTDPIANTLTINLTDVTDYIRGTRGKDIRVGTDGHDVLKGKAGNDKLTGLGGSDTFIFWKGYDKDLIKDFDAAGDDHDILNLKKLNEIHNFKDLMHNHVSERHGNVVINGLHGDVVTLRGVDLDDLGRSDFIF